MKVMSSFVLLGFASLPYISTPSPRLQEEECLLRLCQAIPCRRGCATSVVQSGILIRHAHVLGIVSKAGRNPRPFYEKQQTGGGRGKNGAFATYESF